MKEIIRSSSTTCQPGDLAQLITGRDFSFRFRIVPGDRFQSHLGIILHDELIGKTWGSRVKSHLGRSSPCSSLPWTIYHESSNPNHVPKRYRLPAGDDGDRSWTPRRRSGTGSGALTTALAYLVGDNGHVYSYDKNPSFQQTAQDNLRKFGLDHRVTFKVKHLEEGFDEQDAAAVFLDLVDPENYILTARQALLPGGHLGCFLPTTNQVSLLITALKQHNFEYVEVSEMMHRYYKASATRLRPADKMVRHTGFLIFP